MQGSGGRMDWAARERVYEEEVEKIRRAEDGKKEVEKIRRLEDGKKEIEKIRR